MAAAQDKTDKMSTEKTQKTEGVRFSEKLNEFVQRNRKGLFLGLVVLVVLFVGLVIGLTVREKLQIKAFTVVDAFNERLQTLMPYIGSEEPDAVSKKAEISSLLDELNAFAAKNSGYAAARTYSMIAGIYDGQKNWAEAEKAWTAAGKAAAKSYLGPISVYNAAADAEEQGNTEAAINLYTQVLGNGKSTILAARAQFSIGRLEESRNNKQAALEAYHNILSKWPEDSFWVNLAQNRIILLSN